MRQRHQRTPGPRLGTGRPPGDDGADDRAARPRQAIAAALASARMARNAFIPMVDTARALRAQATEMAEAHAQARQAGPIGPLDGHHQPDPGIAAESAVDAPPARDPGLARTSGRA